jgi:hypothetical protein
VAVPTNVTTADLDYVRDLKQLADPAGIRLSAVGGEPGWTFGHRTARRWQRAVVASGLFEASHVDVEPYLLPEWNTDRGGTVAAYVDLIAALRDDDAARRGSEADGHYFRAAIVAE